jgi:hypothetical protein
MNVTFLRRTSRSFAALIIMLCAISCREVETPHGRIPEAFLAQAKAIAGVYQGVFNRVPTTLIVHIENQLPTLEVVNSLRNDLIGSRCESRPGALQSVTINNKRVQKAKFEFKQGTCPLAGKTLVVELNDTGHVEMEILQSYYWENTCYPNVRADSPPPLMAPLMNSDPMCRWESRPAYLRGAFRKVQ